MAQKIPVEEIAYGRPSSSEAQCTRCSELNQNRIVYASNCTIGGLLVVGEAPGAKEEECGIGFMGDAGKNLNTLLEECNISPEEYGRANICRCRPPDNRRPTAIEINNCLPNLTKLIGAMKPRVILAVGLTASRVLCGKRPLYKLIEARSGENNWSALLSHSLAHKQLQPVLSCVQYIVPMPHTSPLAWNRKSPSGEAWKEIAAKQVEIAAQLMRY